MGIRILIAAIVSLPGLVVATLLICRELHGLRGPPVVNMKAAEHRLDDNWLAEVVMSNARRDALPDSLMGSSPIEAGLVLANQRLQVSVIGQGDVVEHLSPAAAHKSLHDGTHVWGLAL